MSPKFYSYGSSHRQDYKINKINEQMKEKKNNSFLGVPYFYLILFLALILILLILPPQSFFQGFSGRVIDNIQLTEVEYFPNQNLKGLLNIQFVWGDLIPANSLVEFKITSPSQAGAVFSNITLQLPQAIALSSTPWKGNFTYGPFNNMNGKSPSGEGYGFGACPITPPRKQVTTYAISQPQPITPDLTVLDIYTSSSAAQSTAMAVAPPPAQPIERLYTKIKNNGGGSGAFTVVGCWYSGVTPVEPPASILSIPSPELPPNCFYSKYISTGLSFGREMILDMGSWDVEGKTVQVIVDYYNIVPETNENNNQMIKYFGISPQCIDSDGGLNYFIKGTCTDSGQLPYIKEDYCSPDADNLLIEWYCPSIAPSPLCQAVQYVCPDGCEDGRCKEQGPSPTCEDSDGGRNYGKRGTCTDDYGDYTDYCLEVGGINYPNLAEFYCLGNQLMSYDLCSKCTDVQCLYPGTDSEGWYAFCPNEPGPKLIKYVADKCNSKDYVKRFRPVCLYNETRSEGWYTPDVCDRDDFFCFYGCGEGQCKISNYSCEDWNNIYVINLSNLNLKAPQPRGAYTFEVALTYEDPSQGKITMYSDSETFNVASHRACQNNLCVWVNGNGTDQCTTNEQCRLPGGGGGGGGGGACNENWQYTSWSDCIAGKRTRECYDARYCGSTYAKPTYCLPVGNKFIQTESCVPGCQENWQCTEWSYCDEQTLEQSSVCEELNKCNLQNYTYIQLRDCCMEEWDCKWSACKNGVQTKVCTDLNNCGTEFTKPAAETRSCKAMAGLFTWLIIIVIVVVAVVFVLYATKVIGPKRGKVSGAVVSPAKPIKPIQPAKPGAGIGAEFKEIKTLIKK